jgi:hypothetical protein
MTVTKRRRFAAQQLAVVLTFAAIAITSASIARAIEIIPSVGITKSTDDNAGDAQGFGGLAVRFPLLPFQGRGRRRVPAGTFSDGDLSTNGR